MSKKALLFSVASVLTAVAVGVGGTFALFTDTASTAVDLEAGKMCISSARDAFDNVPGPMFYMTGAQGNNGTEDGRYPLAEVSSTSPAGYVPPTPGNWAPGDTVTRTLQVFNGDPVNCKKSLASKLTKVSATLHTDNAATRALASKMHVTVRAQKPGGGMDIVAKGYLSEFLPSLVNPANPYGKALVYESLGVNPNMPAYKGEPIPASLQMEYEVHFDLDATNNLQGSEMIVDFKIDAEQLKNNP